MSIERVITRLERDVAIKVLPEAFATDPDRLRRFEHEARAIAALNHPHICQLYDIGPGYLVLEYVVGEPLHGPMAVEEAVRLALQIVSAIEAAHRHGILHRDLKPPNIMVTREGAAKLLDFGLAKLMALPDGGHEDLTRTIEGTVMGTTAYMAPEQAEGKPLDARSDVFSFGAVLYELLSGRRAFGGANAISTMAAILHKEPAPLDAPAGLDQIVKRCLAKPPGQRYQTMGEIRTALESIAGKLEEQQPSIAVLPFANMSRDADDEYFSDGLAEEIINALTQVSGLKVIARTSAFAFKGKNEDIRKIAEALGVTNVLEGSVRRAGSRLRVTAQLIHAADGTHLWSQRYDRQMTDVFAMQDEISAAIAGALHVKLTSKPGTARRHEPNLPAYEAFLIGEHQQAKVSPEAFVRAEEYYTQAIALDPQWAKPHSALGFLCFVLGFLGLRPVNEMVPLARAEARKALDLPPSDPMAPALLGAIAAVHDYDWKEADEYFRLARASEPLPPIVHLIYTVYYLLPLGRFEEAIQEGAKAIAQDPLNTLWRRQQALALLSADMYDRAIVEARKILELVERLSATEHKGNRSTGERSYPHEVIALSYFFQGKLVEAREPAEESFRLAPWESTSVGLLAGLLAQAGEKDRAEKLHATLRGMSPVGMVMYHVVRSEIDAAIDWYERMIELRDPYAAMWALAGFFNSLRASPRWPKLAKMMNLPDTA